MDKYVEEVIQSLNYTKKAGSREIYMPAEVEEDIGKLNEALVKISTMLGSDEEKGKASGKINKYIELVSLMGRLL